MSKETYRHFKVRMAREGYRVQYECQYNGEKIYRIFTPDRRSFSGTLDEIKEFVGE